MVLFLQRFPDYFPRWFLCSQTVYIQFVCQASNVRRIVIIILIYMENPIKRLLN